MTGSASGGENADTPAALDDLVARCAFPTAGSHVACAFSGGPDSTALVALAVHAGLRVTAHHVDHDLRLDSLVDAERAAEIAAGLGAEFVLHTVSVPAGPNLQARARAARQTVLPVDAMTGHTADDQAETVLMRLLRGSGAAGLAGMSPGPTHPLLALRRSETEAVCRLLGVDPVRDPSNERPDWWRNRVRHELMPLAADIAERDVTTLIARTADLLRQDEAFLDELASSIDPQDAKAVAAAPAVLARRAVRRWLTVDGYPPDAAAIERVLTVARGEAAACELPGGRTVRRTGQRFRIVESSR